MAAAKAEPKHFQQAGTWWHGVPPNFEDMCLCDPSEARSISDESPVPIKACLLLRLGEAELAEKLWSHWTSQLRSFSQRPPYLLSIEKSVGANKSILKDPYLALANCWIMALSDRAVGSHMRGDDHLAMASAEMLNNIWPVVKAEAEKRGFQKPSTREDDQTPYFSLDDFDRAHRLLIDQRRRAEDRKRGLVPPVLIADYLDAEDYVQAMKRELERCPSRAKRVALLVRELEEASQHSVSDQALLHLLVSEGDNAVEPILKCLESDTRLTRSLQEYKQGIYPAGVHYLAASALDEIITMPLTVPEFRSKEPDLQEESRASHAARIRAYWKRYKDLPPEERWYGILADDRAPSYQWLAAGSPSSNQLACR